MAFTITHVIFFVAVGLMSLFFILPWFANEFPTAKAALENIIPNLQQAEKLSASQGFKALHVKIEPGSPVNLYEFHPTNEGALGRKHFSTQTSGYEDYFFLKRFETDKCYIFATPATSLLYGQSWIYRVYPGSKILKTSPKLSSDLAPDEEGCDSQGKCSDMKPGEFTVCKEGAPSYVSADCASSNNDLITQAFTSTTADNCIADEEGCPSINGKIDCCAFAAEQSGGNHIYRPAYNLICGYEGGSSDANWYACGAPIQQKAAVGLETNGGGTQFECKAGEWVVKSGSGVYILDSPQIKYFKSYGVDKQTELRFTIMNNQNSVILNNANIEVDVTNSDKDCYDYTGLIKNDEDTTNYGCGNVAALGQCNFDFDNFCWNSKTFDVALTYTGVTKNFNILCNNAKIDNMDVWQTCTATAILGNVYTLTSPPSEIFNGACNSKNYVSKYVYAGTNSISIEVTENGNIINEGGNPTIEVFKGSSKIINNLKVTLYDVSTTSPYAARIDAGCA